MSIRTDLTNKRFGHLVAIRDVGVNKKGRRLWLCSCDCGKDKIVSSDSLQSGHSRSCGCLITERKKSPEEHRLQRLASTNKWREAHSKHCDEYRRKRALKKYGLTVEQYEEMFQKQDGKCKICKKPSSYWLVVDHNHKTNEVRGLLCHRCNRALGMFRDDAELLAEAIRYLECFGAVETARAPQKTEKIQSELHGNMQSIAEMPMPTLCA